MPYPTAVIGGCSAGSSEPEPATLTQVIIYGQSLSIGSHPTGFATSASIISDPNPNHLMFNRGVRFHYDNPSVGTNVDSFVRPSNMASLVTLAETVNPNETHLQETFASGIALRSSKRLLLTASGRGSMSAKLLSRSGNPEVNYYHHFQNTYASAFQGKILAEAAGYEYSLGPVIFKQGEADGDLSTSKVQWKLDVIRVRNELIAGLKHAIHMDVSDLTMIIDQQAYRLIGKTYEEIAVAAIELHRQGQGIVCAGPTYPEAFVSIGNVHMTSTGYRVYGERLGRVVDAINTGAGWNPCHITSVTRSGTTITVNVHVPSGPLTKDTTLVTAAANSGFVYSGANITAVTITDDGVTDNAGVITITIDSASAGTLNYAYNNATNNARVGPVEGARGNIRDSETAVTNYQSKKLHNWLCVDQWVVA